MATDAAPQPATLPTRASGYAWYVLGILFVVYILNFVDRQIISILAEDIKRDLHLKDEDLGFPVRHRVRRVLLPVRDSAWSARRQLDPRSPHDARVGIVVEHDRAVRVRAEWRHARRCPDRRRHRRGDRQSVGLFADLGLLSEAAARDRARDLFVGPVRRRRTCRSRIGGADRPALEPRLSRWRTVRAARLAGGVHDAVGIPGLGPRARSIATLREPIRGAVEGLPEPPSVIPRRSRNSSPSSSRSCHRLTLDRRGDAAGAACACWSICSGSGSSLVGHRGDAVASRSASPGRNGSPIGHRRLCGVFVGHVRSSAAIRRPSRLIVGNPGLPVSVVIAYGLNAFVSLCA